MCNTERRPVIFTLTDEPEVSTGPPYYCGFCAEESLYFLFELSNTSDLVRGSTPEECLQIYDLTDGQLPELGPARDHHIKASTI